MSGITESEQQALEEGLDTAAIMRAVDAISRLRAELAADESPTIRDELLELHRLAIAVREHGTLKQLSEFFDLANDLELRVCEWMETLGEIQATLSTVTALYPESLAYEGVEEPEE
ncbi:MAG: transposase [Pseudomonadota bacterium]